MSGDIWVFAETKNEEISEVTLEVLSEASRLAESRGVSAGAVLMGCGVTASKMVSQLAAHGVKKIYGADHQFLTVYAPELYTDIISHLIEDYTPSVFLFGASPLTADLSPRVAARVKTGLLANVDRLQIQDDGLLVATRLCYERKVQTTVACPKGRPQMATVVPGIMKIRNTSHGETLQPEIYQIDVEGFVCSDKCRIKHLRFIKTDPKIMDISDAPVIVAGGKGVGDQQQFQIIEKLADLLGAAVAGSRMAVDSGCIGRERQIGQSGKTVYPELLISCGISGANAHTIGMRDAKTVIAINKDKNAPIIKMADLGIVGDLHKIIPVLNRLLMNHQNDKTELQK